MAQILKAILFEPEATPPSWIFLIVTDGVPGDLLRTMKPGEEGDPTRVTLPDPEMPDISHDLVLFRSAS